MVLYTDTAGCFADRFSISCCFPPPVLSVQLSVTLACSMSSVIWYDLRPVHPTWIRLLALLQLQWRLMCGIFFKLHMSRLWSLWYCLTILICRSLLLQRHFSKKKKNTRNLFVILIEFHRCISLGSLSIPCRSCYDNVVSMCVCVGGGWRVTWIQNKEYVITNQNKNLFNSFYM